MIDHSDNQGSSNMVEVSTALEQLRRAKYRSVDLVLPDINTYINRAFYLAY